MALVLVGSARINSCHSLPLSWRYNPRRYAVLSPKEQGFQGRRATPRQRQVRAAAQSPGPELTFPGVLSQGGASLLHLICLLTLPLGPYVPEFLQPIENRRMRGEKGRGGAGVGA